MVEDLRYFALVVDHGTFTAAARRAHVTQPALTASIQRLEASLGGRLFDRGPRGASLTAAGHALLPHARAALAAIEDGARAVSEISGKRAGSVRLGAGATLCTYILPKILARYRERFPLVQIQVRELVTDEIFESLERGEIDLGIVAKKGARGLTESFCDDELVLVTSPSGPWTGDNADPKIAPFVALPHGATARELLEARFSGARVMMELGGIAAVKSNVRAGVGLALLSTRAIERDLTNGQLAIVPHPATPIRRRFFIVHRGADRLPPAAAELRSLLRAHAAKLGIQGRHAPPLPKKV